MWKFVVTKWFIYLSYVDSKEKKVAREEFYFWTLIKQSNFPLYLYVVPIFYVEK